MGNWEYALIYITNLRRNAADARFINLGEPVHSVLAECTGVYRRWVVCAEERHSKAAPIQN